MVEDPLFYIPIEKWRDIQEVLKSDLQRSHAYTVLETQRSLVRKDLGYGFEVYCPYGDVWNGFVAINEKKGFYEIIIQCPNEDTTKLEEALGGTKLINWQRSIILPFTPEHVIECVRKVIKEKNVEIVNIIPSETFFLEKGTPLFQNISLPDGITLDLLSLEHVDLVNSKWPHRYPTSKWYFELLIKNNSAFGLFENNQLISWAFINDNGTLCHMFTIEDHRRKGYAELLLKIVCNVILEEDRDIKIFCVKGNVNACKLYKKNGCKYVDPVAWVYLKPKSSLT